MESRVFFLFVVLGIAHCDVIKSSCDDIRRFVDGHNNRRLQLAQGKIQGQPAAAEMNYMIWDDELAAKARLWAETFPNDHNPNTDVGSGRFSIGESMYVYSTTDLNADLDVDSPLEAWFIENSLYKFGPLKSSDSEITSDQEIGHYTQMAWSDSTYVGCAVSQKTESGLKKFYVVCNYGPSGNYIGQTPYKTGSASGQLVCGIADCSRPYGSTC